MSFLNGLNRIGQKITGFSFAGIATLAAPRAINFGSQYLLAGYLGSTAAAAIAVPVLGGVAPIFAGFAFKAGEKAWEKSPEAFDYSREKITNAYHERGYRGLSAPTSSSLRDGREVTRLRAVLFNALPEEDDWVSCRLV